MTVSRNCSQVDGRQGCRPSMHGLNKIFSLSAMSARLPAYMMLMAYVRGDVGSENGIVAISADTD